MAEEAIYEMLWDCEYCNTKKLLGKTHRHCPNCGATQDPARRYFPSDQDKVAVKDHVYFGADKVCPFCQTANGANATFCGNCGGSLDGSKEVVKRSDRIAGQGEDSVAKAKSELEEKANPGKVGESSPSDLAFPDSQFIKPHPKTPTWIKWTLSIIGISALSFFLLAIFWTESVEVQVTGHTWKRSIEIEKFLPKQDSEWCDAKPLAAYNISRKSEVRSTRQVADGETCTTVQRDKGDGTFSESESCTTNYTSEPVYDDKCYYTIDRWSSEKTESTEGKSITDEPYWPALSLNSCFSEKIGCEREGSKNEIYLVLLSEASGDSKGKVHDCDFEQATWKQYQVGSIYSAEKSVIMDSISCSELKPLKKE